MLTKRGDKGRVVDSNGHKEEAGRGECYLVFVHMVKIEKKGKKKLDFVLESFIMLTNCQYRQRSPFIYKFPYQKPHNKALMYFKVVN